MFQFYKASKVHEQIIKELSVVVEKFYNIKIEEEYDISFEFYSTKERPKEKPNMNGCVTFEEWGSRMIFYNGDNLVEFIMTACHEFVHIKQIIKDGFKTIEDKKFAFQNKEYEMDTNYWTSPWEIEAYTYQVKIFDEFIQICSENIIEEIHLLENN